MNKCSGLPSTSTSDLYQQVWPVCRTSFSFSGFVASFLLGNWRQYAKLNINNLMNKFYFDWYLKMLRIILNDKDYEAKIVSMNAAGCQIKTPEMFLADFNDIFNLDILDRVFQNLSQKDLNNAQLVCHQWQNLVKHRKSINTQKVIPMLIVSYDRNNLKITSYNLKDLTSARIINMELNVYGVLEDLDSLALSRIQVENLYIYFYHRFDERNMMNLVVELSHNIYLVNLQLICFGKKFPEWFEQAVKSTISFAKLKSY